MARDEARTVLLEIAVAVAEGRGRDPGVVARAVELLDALEADRADRAERKRRGNTERSRRLRQRRAARDGNDNPSVAQREPERDARRTDARCATPPEALQPAPQRSTERCGNAAGSVAPPPTPPSEREERSEASASISLSKEEKTALSSPAREGETQRSIERDAQRAESRCSNALDRVAAPAVIKGFARRAIVVSELKALEELLEHARHRARYGVTAGERRRGEESVVRLEAELRELQKAQQARSA